MWICRAMVGGRFGKKSLNIASLPIIKQWLTHSLGSMNLQIGKSEGHLIVCQVHRNKL